MISFKKHLDAYIYMQYMPSGLYWRGGDLFDGLGEHFRTLKREINVLSIYNKGRKS